ncbi:pyrroline-5-carboxylate reductase [Acetobacter pomorum]|uniref:Pyrroline-5-carboxylate reductase n=1 Tax=Acetobacter pomorum TaxID=65959 RepID=A0A2G4RDD2_9PROT|nr:pyrroline-5-carboxylate reductase [Acetobacter pomorum]PHY94591.1 pyrroline-5-carboxylate reductase [Acetobacter pomorum]GBR45510.1 pyrroline-5-carboxylate reductase [Acetobacter pomorum DSM 11825]
MTKSPLLPSILLVGCGKMGGAMLEGWLAHGLAPSVIMDRHLPELPAPHRVVRTLDAIPAEFKPDVILLAVKPQKANGVLAELAPRFPNATLLSVMAGRTIASLLKAYRVGHAAASPIIIRSMPNTPSALGAGMSGLYAPPEASEKQKKQCEQLLSAVGETVWVAQEGLIDSVAAISGSGPAYVFLLAELLEQAGVEQGLDAKTARTLARGTIYGAGQMLHQLPTDAAELRRNVTSPGGTTEAALKVLMASDAWPQAVSTAISAAVNRAKELAS